MDGADRRTSQLFGALLAHGVEGCLVGRNATLTEGRCVPHASPSRWRENKSLAALAALATGRDYWQVKLMGPAVWNAARLAGQGHWDVIVVHFLYALPLLSAVRQTSCRLVVDTHNYDPGVFGGFRDATRNPLTKMLCNRAIETSRRELARLPKGTAMVHVTAADADSWRRDRPDLLHAVIENGCRVNPRQSQPRYADPVKQLIFVGSLSAQMNKNALEHFASTFWPQLRSVARLRVVGSNPSPDVLRLCQDQGWELRANVSEDGLNQAYEDAHFAILPFGYGAGSKLKLFEALGRGLPLLATPAGVGGTATLPDCVHVSASAADWHAELLRTTEFSEGSRQQALEFSHTYSWPTLGRRLKELLASVQPVQLH
jgi:glycosyltransferase involved in cell wall biosynthesis